ncbi:MAG: hypothetical protein J6Y29_03880 [Clostridiales bacterium]|nr:hypothetical protein [Clostridiales bacterium]
MYVVKLGNFYVKSVDVEFGGFIREILLSKEIMRNFTEEGAERIAQMINGEVINIGDVETNDR